MTTLHVVGVCASQLFRSKLIWSHHLPMNDRSLGTTYNLTWGRNKEIIMIYRANWLICSSGSEWVIKSNGFSPIVDSEVHVIHISLVIITSTLKEYALSPTVSYESQGINVKKKNVTLSPLCHPLYIECWPTQCSFWVESLYIDIRPNY